MSIHNAEIQSIQVLSYPHTAFDSLCSGANDAIISAKYCIPSKAYTHAHMLQNTVTEMTKLIVEPPPPNLNDSINQRRRIRGLLHHVLKKKRMKNRGEIIESQKNITSVGLTKMVHKPRLTTSHLLCSCALRRFRNRRQISSSSSITKTTS